MKFLQYNCVGDFVNVLADTLARQQTMPEQNILMDKMLLNNTEHEQEDAEEYLQWLMGQIEPSLKRVEHGKLIRTLNPLEFLVTEEKICLVCGKSSHMSAHVENVLRLSPARDVSIEDMLPNDDFVEGHAACFYCSTVNKIKSNLYVRRHIARPAKLLVVCFNRISQFGRRLVKNSYRFSYRETLNFAGRHYKLIALVLHLGRSVNEGHYVNYRIDVRTGKWLFQSDSVTREVSSIEEVYSNTENVCLLFFSL